MDEDSDQEIHPVYEFMSHGVDLQWPLCHTSVTNPQTCWEVMVHMLHTAVPIFWELRILPAESLNRPEKHSICALFEQWEEFYGREYLTIGKDSCTPWLIRSVFTQSSFGTLKQCSSMHTCIPLDHLAGQAPKGNAQQCAWNLFVIPDCNEHIFKAMKFGHSLPINKGDSEVVFCMVIGDWETIFNSWKLMLKTQHKLFKFFQLFLSNKQPWGHCTCVYMYTYLLAIAVT